MKFLPPLSRSLAVVALIGLGSPGQAFSQSDSIKVTLLGTGAPAPDPGRFGPATLVEAGAEKLLFDVGRGAVTERPVGPEGRLIAPRVGERPPASPPGRGRTVVTPLGRPPAAVDAPGRPPETADRPPLGLAFVDALPGRAAVRPPLLPRVGEGRVAIPVLEPARGVAVPVFAPLR